MKQEVTIINHERRPKLSTCRVTVQDLVPYFIEGCADEEIQKWIPTLTSEEIRVAKNYFQENRSRLLEKERLLEQRNSERVNPPELEKIRLAGKEKLRALKEQFLGKNNTKGESR